MHGAGGDDAADPNLIPLLDLVFQLIMFFMITVNFVRVDQINEAIELPIAQAAVPLEKSAEEFVFLNIDKNGRLVGNMDNLNADGRLEESLRIQMTSLERKARLLGEQGDPKVVMVLRAHKEARYRQIWNYLEIGKKAGIKHFQFRAMKKPV